MDNIEPTTCYMFAVPETTYGPYGPYTELQNAITATELVRMIYQVCGVDIKTITISEHFLDESGLNYLRDVIKLEY
jgi:hypothetical protein